MSKLKIVPVNGVDGSHRTGGIEGLTKAQIDGILGFKPNVQDDPSKVKHSWAFSALGSDCAVWDYKGSHRLKRWSAYGPDAVLREVFGDAYVCEGGDSRPTAVSQACVINMDVAILEWARDKLKQDVQALADDPYGFCGWDAGTGWEIIPAKAYLNLEHVAQVLGMDIRLVLTQEATKHEITRLEELVGREIG